jgi:hypothetical protein
MKVRLRRYPANKNFFPLIASAAKPLRTAPTMVAGQLI